MKKKVFLCIVDSLHPGVLEQCFAQGLVPNLHFLRQNGFYYPNCVSVFPTMTPTATSSIITGTQVDQHGVPGFIWYNYQHQLWENYGATFSAIFKQGINRTLNNWFFRLNHCHLRPEALTIHEHLSKKGFTSANINFFMRRGLIEHNPKLPLAMRFLIGDWAQQKKIKGPEQLILGKLVYPKEYTMPSINTVWPWKRYGINDAFTASACLEMLGRGELPDLTLLYFPDNDHYSHRYGPWATPKIIRQVDNYLGQILMAFGSKTEALKQAIFLVLGDHAQTPILQDKNAIIELELLLAPYRVLKIRHKRIDHCDVVISPNERMAYVDILHGRTELKLKLTQLLVKDSRIAQVMWREKDTYYVLGGGTARKLIFSSGKDVYDPFDAGWDFTGDLSLLDGVIKEQRVTFNSYPDAFNRIKHALEARPETTIILSAAPGYEFGGESAAIHRGGGSHGSLHMEDSLVPAIIAGAEQGLTRCRIDEIVPYILRYFQI